MPTAEEYAYILANAAPIVLMVVAFYFFLIRPQKKRDKAEKAMRESVIVGDEISTIGGLIGKVVNIKDDTLTIESGADRTRIVIYKWAVRKKENEVISD